MQHSALTKAIAASGWLIAAIAAGKAQPDPKPPGAIEKVIVTAPRFNFAVTPNAIAHEFIGSYAMPSLLLGTIPRWHASICLEIRGVRPEFQATVEQRVRDIAIQAGAPVGRRGCKPNLSITFTPEPQKLLDNIRAKNALALGYHGSTSISHPVQAWYETGIRDIDGRTEVDRDPIGSDAVEENCRGQYGAPPCWRILTSKIGGWRGRTDLSSDFLTVFIIVDTRQTSALMVGAVADYAAMMALSETQTYDACENVPSIANLLSANCDDKLKPEAITANDIAYLRGVYRMDSSAPLQIQQDQIAGEMAKALTGR